MYSTIGMAIVVGFFFTWLITRSVVRPAVEIAEVSEALAQGDLTRRINYRSRDEIGQMAESLRHLLSGVIGEGQSIKQGIPIALWTADKDLKTTFLNSPAARIAKPLTGKSADQLIGQVKIGEVMKDKDGIISRMARESMEKGTVPEARVMFDLGGERIYVRQFTSQLKDLNEKVVGVMGVGIDITAQKRVEDLLVESESRFRSAFEQANVGMGLIALDGTFMMINNELAGILGYPKEELVGKSFADVTHPDDLEKGRKFIRQAQAGELDSIDFEKRYLNKNGGIIWGEVVSTLVRDQSDTPQYFVTHIQDITDRRKSEERIKASLKEKEILLREIHHRVKNNMQIVSSLLNLQQRSYKNESLKARFPGKSRQAHRHVLCPRISL